MDLHGFVGSGFKVPVPSLALFLRHLRIIVRAARRKHQETSPHLAPSDGGGSKFCWDTNKYGWFMMIHDDMMMKCF